MNPPNPTSRDKGQVPERGASAVETWTGITGATYEATCRRREAYDRWFSICTCGHGSEQHPGGNDCSVKHCQCTGYDHISGKPDHPLNPLAENDPRRKAITSEHEAERERLEAEREREAALKEDAYRYQQAAEDLLNPEQKKVAALTQQLQVLISEEAEEQFVKKLREELKHLDLSDREFDAAGSLFKQVVEERLRPECERGDSRDEVMGKLQAGYSLCHPEDDCAAQRAWLKAAGDRDSLADLVREAVPVIDAVFKYLEESGLAETSLKLYEAVKPMAELRARFAAALTQSDTTTLRPPTLEKDRCKATDASGFRCEHYPGHPGEHSRWTGRHTIHWPDLGSKERPTHRPLEVGEDPSTKRLSPEFANLIDDLEEWSEPIEVRISPGGRLVHRPLEDERPELQEEDRGGGEARG